MRRLLPLLGGVICLRDEDGDAVIAVSPSPENDIVTLPGRLDMAAALRDCSASSSGLSFCTSRSPSKVGFSSKLTFCLALASSSALVVSIRRLSICIFANYRSRFCIAVSPVIEGAPIRSSRGTACTTLEGGKSISPYCSSSRLCAREAAYSRGEAVSLRWKREMGSSAGGRPRILRTADSCSRRL